MEEDEKGMANISWCGIALFNASISILGEDHHYHHHRSSTTVSTLSLSASSRLVDRFFSAGAAFVVVVVVVVVVDVVVVVSDAITVVVEDAMAVAASLWGTLLRSAPTQRTKVIGESRCREADTSDAKLTVRPRVLCRLERRKSGFIDRSVDSRSSS